jgi:hypothetical protein
VNTTTKSSDILLEAVNHYRLELGGVKFWTPYWRDSLPTLDQPRPASGPFKGKGTPEELLEYLQGNRDFDREYADGEDYRQEMRNLKLGIDCSGFAYYILSQWLSETMGETLDNHLYKPRQRLLDVWHNPLLQHPPRITEAGIMALPEQVSLRQIQEFWGNNPVRLADVAVLTSTAATVAVLTAGEVRPGDIVRMRGADDIAHCVVIVEVAEHELTFAHSGRISEDELGGVELGKIQINDPQRSLVDQTWGTIEVKNTLLSREPVRRLKIVANHVE